MKKILNYILFLFFVIFLTSCFWSKDEIDQAKKELWIIESDVLDNDTWSNIDLLSEEEIETGSGLEIVEVEEVKKIEITYLTDEKFIELDDLSNKNISSWEIEITWKTLTKVDKINVIFENKESKFPLDSYTLKQFVAWSNTFLYRAFSRYETFDYWKNVYIIEAYSWDKVSKLQLVINLLKDDEVSSSKNIETISENISMESLPVWEKFWNPISLWNGKISYSDLKWLEIQKFTINDLSCENLSEVLSQKIHSWYYWNTCRPIKTNEWFSFFVIRLDGDKYFYEKHYYLSYEWIYWVQELETWEWVDIKNIKEKNLELKEKNQDYSITEITDKLFKEILN